MILVVDSNIVFAALLKKSTTRKLLLDPPCLLYAPRILLQEIKKYEEQIQERTGLSKKDLETLLGLVLENITFVDKEKYKESMKEAEELMADIDLGDVPFVALALEIRADAIWTENVRHFGKQQRIKVCKTKDVLDFF